MSAEDMIERAKVRLVLRHVFIASLLLSLRVVCDKDTKTLCTDGRVILYNPEFVEAGSPDDVVFYLAHEVMHTALLHNYRVGTRDPHRANIAMDHAINLILKDEGFSVDATRFHCDPAYAGMAWEEIYPLLPDTADEDDMGADVKPAGTSEEGVTESEMRVKVAQAAGIARAQGKLSAGVEKFVAKVLKGETNWREELRQFMSITVKTDQSWARPNRRHIARGVYLPSLHTEAIGEIVVIVDTSGSCWEDGGMFLSEVQAICQELHPEKVHVLMVDAKVREAKTYEPWDELHMGLKGGGGTNMSPGFAWVEEQGITPAVCLVFTDMEMRFPDNPGYPVLWVTRARETTPPWGEVVRL